MDRFWNDRLNYIRELFCMLVLCYLREVHCCIMYCENNFTWIGSTYWEWFVGIFLDISDWMTSALFFRGEHTFFWLHVYRCRTVVLVALSWRIELKLEVFLVINCWISSMSWVGFEELFVNIVSRVWITIGIVSGLFLHLKCSVLDFLWYLICRRHGRGWEDITM